MKMKIFALLLLSVNVARAQTLPVGSNSRNFQYLTAVLAPGALISSVTANAWNAQNPPKWFTLGTATTDTGFQVALEGSLDKLAWSEIAVTNTTTGNISNKSPVPSLYFRLRALAMSAGTNVTATAIGVW